MQSTRMTSPRKVRFNDDANETYLAIHRLDYTPEEKEATFLTSQDLVQIKRKIREIIYLMNDGERDILRSDPDHYCTRGLENLTRAKNFTRKSHKMIARRAVLEEQRYQYAYQECIYNPERLAKASAQAIAARMAGSADAENAAIAAGRNTSTYPLKPMEVEMALPEIFVRAMSHRVSFVSQVA
jgi:hypothetical protein